MSPRTVRIAGLAGAALGGAVAYALYPDSLLAATTALCWGGGAAFTLRERAAWSGAADSSLADGIPGLLVLAVGLFGVHAGLDVPDPLRWALVVLVGGAVLFATSVGVALGRREEAASASVPTTE